MFYFADDVPAPPTPPLPTPAPPPAPTGPIYRQRVVPPETSRRNFGVVRLGWGGGLSGRWSRVGRGVFFYWSFYNNLIALVVDVDMVLWNAGGVVNVLPLFPYR